MTNREWMEQLSDEDLANFLTIGLKKKYISGTSSAYVGGYFESIADIARHYTQSTTGIMQWINEVHKDN